MVSAAGELLGALDKQQRKTVTFRLDDEATRTDWAYFPRQSHGLPLGAMDAKQQKLAHRLVAAGLSLHAYAKVTTIISLDNVLDVIEGRRLSVVRDPGRYFLSIFGDLTSPPWAWQFEGHHVSLNFTLGDDGIVSPTPLFLGSNPAEIMHGGIPIVRVCGEEEDAARDLLRSLGAFERARAIICDVAPPDLVLANAPRVPQRHLAGETVQRMQGVTEVAIQRIQARFDEMSAANKQALMFDLAKPLGLPVSKMTPAQRERMSALVDVYVDRLPEDLARIERAKIDAAGFDALYFAWAGDEQRRRGHYYRIQGPSLLIEYDNTQDDANHIHAVWRDPTADFGVDILRKHVASH